MPDPLLLYMAAWGLACLVAAGLLWRRRARFTLTRRAYWRFLLRDWKLATFAIAASGMVVIAPYTGDPTWDYVDAGFMSLLTFLTAPWAVGVLYRLRRDRGLLAEAYCAACAWLFSASWSYDGYLYLRDGFYPITWLPNLFASSVLYACGGLLWSLQWRAERGVIFGFMAADWPAPSAPGELQRVVLYGLPFMLIVAVMILSFLW